MSVVINQRYRVRGWVGSGETGQVLRVEDLRRPGIPLAMKVARGDAGQGDSRGIFTREFLALSDLDHPAIARAFELDEVRHLSLGGEEAEQPGADVSPGAPFLVREFVLGQDLLTATGPLDLQGRLRILWQLAVAVAYIHDQGLLHRDLKPDNVYVRPLAGEAGPDPWVVRILDFGFAVEGGSREVRSGTAQYLAPEVLRGEAATVRAELYALGLVMQEVITRVHPFAAHQSTIELVRAHLSEHVATLDEIPAEVAAILTRLMAKRPEHRPASAREVVAALSSAVGAGLTPPVGAARLVGRGWQMSFLREQLEVRAQGGVDFERLREVPAAAVITGAPGSGKSRLVRWLRALAQSMALRTFGEVQGEAPGEAGVATGWQAMFRAVLADRRSSRRTPYLGMLEAAVDNRDVAWAGHLSPEDAWGRLREAGVALLAEEGRVRPLVLIFEDLHRADAETVEWFEYLARNLFAGGVLLVGTAWPPGPTAEAVAELQISLEDTAHAHWLHLDGLSTAEVSQLARRLLGVDPGREVAERLRAHTDGNPLFLEELSRGAGSAGGILALMESDQVPGAVGEASRAQLDRLPPEAQRCLEALAVLGRASRAEEIAQVLDAPRDAVAAGLSVAARARLIRAEGDRYSFIHGMLAQVCEGRPGDERLAALHRRAAELSAPLGEPLALQRLAQHWRWAGEPARALSALEEAAQLAERRFQVRLATELYGQALELVEAGASLEGESPAAAAWRLRARRAHLHMWGGAYEEAEAEAREMLASGAPGASPAGEGESPAALWSLLGQIATRRADYDAALEAFGRALEESAGLAAAEILDHMAEVDLRRGAPDEAQAACEEALARLGEGAPEEARAAVLRGSIATHLGRIAQDRGRYGDALAHLRSARDLYQRAEHLRGSAEVLAAIAGIREVRDEPEEAVSAHEESLALSERAGDVEGTASTLQRLGMAQYMAGDLQAGVSCLERSLDLYRQLSNPQGEARVLNGLGLLHHVRGAYMDAIAVREAAQEKQAHLGDRTGLAMTRVSLAILYYEIGALSQARELATGAYAELKGTGQMLRIARCRNILGMVCSLAGEAARAVEELEAAEAMFRQLEAGDYASVTQAGLAEHWLRVGDLARARIAGDAAIARARSLGRPALMQILVTRARLLLADPHGETDSAVQALSRARIIATKLNYADYLCQVFELWGRIMLKASRPREACGWLTRAMDVVYACHQQLPEELKDIFVQDPRRQVVHNALQLALRQAQRGGRRGRERHEPGIL